MAATETRSPNASSAVSGAHHARATTPRGMWMAAKRVLDVVVVLAALIVLAPLLTAVALAVRLDSSGPLLFRQRRLGRDLRPFTVLKFRTMHDGCSGEMHKRYIAALVRAEASDSTSQGLKKLQGDPRVTRVGRVLRRLSIDELPQMLNVLRGDMSLIGPRPALEYELDHYQPEHYQRFAVRPGISGLWQVSGRNQLGFGEMLDLDVRYTKSCTALTDLRVFVRTPQAMVRGGA
jgi:lipopolysaccharide/colanic/teichoic acid biosynthesis glycosyltransferase